MKLGLFTGGYDGNVGNCCNIFLGLVKKPALAKTVCVGKRTMFHIQ